MQPPQHPFGVLALSQRDFVSGPIFAAVMNYAEHETIASGVRGKIRYLFSSAGMESTQALDEIPAVRRREVCRELFDARESAFREAIHSNWPSLIHTGGFFQFDPQSIRMGTPPSVIIDLAGAYRSALWNALEKWARDDAYPHVNTNDVTSRKTPYVVAYANLLPPGATLPQRHTALEDDVRSVATHYMEHRHRILENLLLYTSPEGHEPLTPPEGIDIKRITQALSRAPDEPRRSHPLRAAYERVAVHLQRLRA